MLREVISNRNFILRYALRDGDMLLLYAVRNGDAYVILLERDVDAIEAKGLCDEGLRDEGDRRTLTADEWYGLSNDVVGDLGLRDGVVMYEDLARCNRVRTTNMYADGLLNDYRYVVVVVTTTETRYCAREGRDRRRNRRYLGLFRFSLFFF